MSEEPIENNESGEEGVADWYVTFGDLMSLLLCFFVLLLSFSEMDRKKYKMVSGSMKNAFGLQRQTPVFDSPKGMKIIAKDFDQAVIVTQMEEKIAKPVLVEVNNKFNEWKDLIQVEVNEEETTIRMMGETTFDTGKAEIRPKMKLLLNKIGSILMEAKGDIIIAGHTDNVPLKGGRYQSNLRLSTARAASVVEHLLQHTRIAPERLSTMGFGEYRPLASNRTPEGREKNRRVEIILSN